MCSSDLIELGMLEQRQEVGRRDHAALRMHPAHEPFEGMHRAAREPIDQSVRGGSQTPGRLFGRDDDTIRAAEGALRASVGDSVAGLAERLPDPRVDVPTAEAGQGRRPGPGSGRPSM